MVNHQDVTVYDPPVVLQNSRWYYWRVDALEPNTLPGGTGYIVHKGPIWSFKTVPLTPIIETFDNVVSAMDILPATLSATVLNSLDSEATFTLLVDDYEYPTGATVGFSQETSNPGAPTCTLVPDKPGTYKVKLVVTKTGFEPIEQISKLVVYEDSCQAIKALGTFEANYYDRDEDCDVDLDDLSDFVQEWLDYNGLADEESYSGEVIYIPASSLILTFPPKTVPVAIGVPA